MIRRTRQRGVILVTVLVFLLILMIVGLASVRDASVEEKMSSADQQMQRAFQMAETGIDEVLQNPDAFIAGGTDYTGSTGLAGPDGSGANITVEYVGVTDLPAGSNSSSGYHAHHFKIHSEGVDRADSMSGGQIVVPAGATVTTVERGAWKLGP